MEINWVWRCVNSSYRSTTWLRRQRLRQNKISAKIDAHAHAMHGRHGASAAAWWMVVDVDGGARWLFAALSAPAKK